LDIEIREYAGYSRHAHLLKEDCHLFATCARSSSIKIAILNLVTHGYRIYFSIF